MLKGVSKDTNTLQILKAHTDKRLSNTLKACRMFSVFHRKFENDVGHGGRSDHSTSLPLHTAPLVRSESNLAGMQFFRLLLSVNLSISACGLSARPPLLEEASPDGFSRLTKRTIDPEKIENYRQIQLRYMRSEYTRLHNPVMREQARKELRQIHQGTHFLQKAARQGQEREQELAKPRTPAVPAAAHFKLVFYVPTSHLAACKAAIFTAGAGCYPAGKYTECCWSTMGIGQFRAGDTANPHLGRVGEVAEEPEARVETLCTGEAVARRAVKALTT